MPKPFILTMTAESEVVGQLYHLCDALLSPDNLVKACIQDLFMRERIVLHVPANYSLHFSARVELNISEPSRLNAGTMRLTLVQRDFTEAGLGPDFDFAYYADACALVTIGSGRLPNALQDYLRSIAEQATLMLGVEQPDLLVKIALGPEQLNRMVTGIHAYPSEGEQPRSRPSVYAKKVVPSSPSNLLKALGLDPFPNPTEEQTYGPRIQKDDF